MTAEISIHALREESDPVKRRNHIRNCISIHALREESDALHTIDQLCLVVISIHALREESDLRVALKILFKLLFLSTLSVRRATPNSLA